MKITLSPIEGGEFKSVRWAGGRLTVNGQIVEAFDGMVIEYDQEAKSSTFSDDEAVRIEVIPSTWADTTPPVLPDPAEVAAQSLMDWRSTATAEAWQIALVLGEDQWGMLEVWADSYFNTRILVSKATNIPRISPTVSLMAWVLNYDDEQVDGIFRVAAEITA